MKNEWANARTLLNISEPDSEILEQKMFFFLGIAYACARIENEKNDAEFISQLKIDAMVESSLIDDEINDGLAN